MTPNVIFIVTEDVCYADMINVGVFKTEKEAKDFVVNNKDLYEWRNPKIQKWIIGLKGVDPPEGNRVEGKNIKGFGYD